jgi:hypothetical protein
MEIRLQSQPVFRRLTFIMSAAAVVMFLVAALGYQVVRADDALGYTNTRINLRASPSAKATIMMTLEGSTPVVLEARNSDATWLLIHSRADTSRRGWALASFLTRAANVKLYSLPISTELVGNGTPPPPAANGTPSLDTVPAYQMPLLPLPSNIPGGAINAPILPNITPAIRKAMRAVYLYGQHLGNNAQVFSKVGDCHTDHPLFFNEIGVGQYNLGSYGNLQGIINYFSTSPRAGNANSFVVHSQAAYSAWSSGAVLDWQNANTDLCMKQESPLRCEYRLDKPSVAIIMFGVVDVEVMTAAQFNTFMRYIVKDTLDRGIIPLLSTEGENTHYLDKARQFNQIVVGLAREKNLPLINLEGALASLPGKGMADDGIHLTPWPDSAAQTAVFNDSSLKFGYTMRNLVTLEALDELQKQIMTN